MTYAFIYLAIGATIVGLLAGREVEENPIGYALSIGLWPFIAITVAASMVADAIRDGAK